jgi:signal transduction histidine kinase
MRPRGRLLATGLARLFLLSLMLQTVLPSPAADAQAPLTRVADIRRLSREQAVAERQVRVRGVCTLVRLGNFFFHDGDEGIWVTATSQPVNGLAARAWEKGVLEVGAELEIKGVTTAGGYAPSIFLREARRVGERELPMARRVPFERILAGNEDAQRVEVEGVVQDAGQQWGEDIRMILNVGGNRCIVAVPTDRATAERWVDARVRVRGMCAPDYNSRAQAVGAKIMLNGPQDIEVLSPAPEDPFAARSVELSQLMHFSADADPFRRRLTEGTVIFAVPGDFFFLQNGELSVRVRAPGSTARPGQRLAVAGFLDRHAMFAELENAVTRAIGEAPIPEPVPATVAQLLSTDKRASWMRASASDLNGRAVVVRGVLRQVDWLRERVPERILAEADGKPFDVRFPIAQEMRAEEAARWVTGAEILCSGVAELTFAEKISVTGEFPPTGFHLWLAKPGDVRVERLPPWWTPQRLALALGGTGALVALLFAWSWLLRRRVERQTRIIAEKNQLEAAHAERERIARDLHDEIGANLTHISILSTVAGNPETTPELVRRHTGEAAAVAQQTIRAFDEILWSINPREDSLQSLSHYLCRCVEETLAPSGIAHRFTLDENFPTTPVPPQSRHGLLLALKEALHNILKHAAAKRVEMRCAVEGASFLMSIADDGRGFDPAAAEPPRGRERQGLGNLRHRLADLGGECRIESAPGTGTRITFRLPLADQSSTIQ